MYMQCQICGRLPPEKHQEKHHLVPKSRGGKETIDVCAACGDQIHVLFTIKQLEKEYNTLDKLLNNSKIQTWIKWIRKKKNWTI